MTATPSTRPLDRDEAEMIQQSQALDSLDHSERLDLLRRLRSRRDRAQRMIRSRTRQARAEGSNAGPDTGARDKKALLTEAIARVAAAVDTRGASRKASTATDHLREAVAAKAESHPWRGPEDRTTDVGPADTPNTRIAPSGALHAEGMRAAIARSTGDR
ncbi:hypothetical protein [Brevundimonas sp.]|uniref:hypothetical protein n=1 Tax=Brevundimonas sp. TaxID=1871086 RepID=UPI003A90D197